jgi:hypothetical protein
LVLFKGFLVNYLAIWYVFAHLVEILPLWYIIPKKSGNLRLSEDVNDGASEEDDVGLKENLHRMVSEVLFENN